MFFLPSIHVSYVLRTHGHVTSGSITGPVVRVLITDPIRLVRFVPVDQVDDEWEEHETEFGHSTETTVRAFWRSTEHDAKTIKNTSGSERSQGSRRLPKYSLPTHQAQASWRL